MIAARAWLRNYDRAWISGDLVAGVTLAAYLVPAAIGDASLARLPPQAGLYACLFSGLVFWLLCSSRQTAISVTSAISMLLGATLGDMAGSDPARLAALAAGTALIVAAVAFVAYVFRAGSVVNFFSETVLVGFKAGLAGYLASTQLPKLFGFSGRHGDFVENIGDFLHRLDQTNATSLALGLAALTALLVGKALFANRPVALFVLAGSIAAASMLDLDRRGVALLGEVPRGVPLPAVPMLSLADIRALVPLALACFLLGAVETAAIGRMFATKHGYRFDATQEFLAIGGANLVAGLGGGFPVSGGSSQSLVNDAAGARTPLAGLVAGILTLFVALFLTGLLRDLPQPVVAAIVLAAVTGLVDLRKVRDIRRFSRAEFAVAVAAFLCVLGLGPLHGVLVAVVISILLLIRRASHPRVVEVGQVPGTEYFADLTRHPENVRVPDVLAVRPEGALVYFNVDHVRDCLDELVAARPAPPRLVILLLGNVPYIDLAGADFLLALRPALDSRGIGIGFAEARGQVRDALRRAAGTATEDLVVANQTIADLLRSPVSGLRSPDALNDLTKP